MNHHARHTEAETAARLDPPAPQAILDRCPDLTQAVIHDPTFAYWVLDRDLEIRFVSDRAAATLAGAAPDQLVGRNLRNITHANVCERFQRIFATLDDTSAPIVGYALWNGQRVRSVYLPIRDAQGRVTEILGVTRPAPLAHTDLNDEPFRIDIADYADFGPLDALTPRELEVLAFMGRGLSRKDIAQTLHRSEATVKRFRENIATKLGVGDRTHLAALARDAGLAPEHAQLARVQKRIPSAPRPAATSLN